MPDLTKTKHVDRWLALLVGGLALIGYLLVSPTGFSLGDGPELAASAAVLGIPHPPGYPVFTNLGRLFAAPFEDALRGLRLLNILAVSAAMGFVFGALRSLDVQRPGAVFGAALFSASTVAVRGAVFVEVYGLALLGLAVVLWAVVRSVGDEASAKDLLVLSLCYGLTLAHHITLVFLAPAVVYALARYVRKDKPPAAFYALFATAGLVGLASYLYLPVRTAAGPAVAWFEPDSLERLGFVLTGAGYGEFWGVGGAYLWRNAGLLGVYLLRQLPLYLVVASLAGLVLLAKRRPWLSVLLAAGVLANLYWASRYASIILDVFFLPGAFVLVFASVYALGASFGRLTDMIQRKGMAARWSLRGAGAVVVLSLAVTGYVTASEPEDSAVDPHGRNLLRCSPVNAVTLFSGDLSFPLLYHRLAVDRRPDLVVADGGGMITSSRVRRTARERLAGGAPVFCAETGEGGLTLPTARWGYGYLFPPDAAAGVRPPSAYLEKIEPGGVYADEAAARYLLARLESPGGDGLWETVGDLASKYAGASTHAHLALGRWLLQNDLPSAAGMEFRRASELNPWLPSARYDSALACLALGDPPGARAELEAALAGFGEPEVRARAANLLLRLR